MTKLAPTSELVSSDQIGDVAGDFPSAEAAQEYANQVASAHYHADRIRALKYLVAQLEPSQLVGRSLNAMDFGVGDGGVLKSLGVEYNRIVGLDISEAMIRIAEKTLGAIANQFIGHTGSVEALRAVPSGSIDLCLCINTLGYMTADEQVQMFQEFARVTKPGGHLLVMVGNELFDLFALNSLTAVFFKKHLTEADITKLLSQGAEQAWQTADRRNPLSFKHELREYGFSEGAQSFAGWHSVPPAIALQEAGGDFVKARSIMRDPVIDPNLFPPAGQWKNNFICSNFCSLSVREA